MGDSEMLTKFRQSNFFHFCRHQNACERCLQLLSFFIYQYTSAPFDQGMLLLLINAKVILKMGLHKRKTNVIHFFCWLGHLKMSFYYPTSHMRARGSILLVHYSMIVLKPAILIKMAVVRYNHTPIYHLPCHFRIQPGIITGCPIGRQVWWLSVLIETQYK